MIFAIGFLVIIMFGLTLEMAITFADLDVFFAPKTDSIYKYMYFALLVIACSALFILWMEVIAFMEITAKLFSGINTVLQ